MRENRIDFSRPRLYAGIGSRETPWHICQLMTMAAHVLSVHGYVLRSGGADKADMAFERGGGPDDEIFLPWKGFNGNHSPLFLPEDIDGSQPWEIAKAHCPYWDNCNEVTRRMFTRNTLQILGSKCNVPVQFVLCWTSNGKDKGGTGQAMRVAQGYGIPVFNYFNRDDGISFWKQMASHGIVRRR